MNVTLAYASTPPLTRRFIFEGDVSVPTPLEREEAEVETHSAILPSLETLQDVVQEAKKTQYIASELGVKDTNGMVTLFKAPSMQLRYRPTPVHPYFIGLWLGDGSRHGPTVYNYYEPEVLGFIRELADTLDMAFSWQGRLSFAIVERHAQRTADKEEPPWRHPEERDEPVRRGVRASVTSILAERIAKGWTRIPGPGIGRWRLPDGTEVRVRRMEPDSAARPVHRVSSPTASEDEHSGAFSGLQDDSIDPNGDGLLDQALGLMEVKFEWDDISSKSLSDESDDEQPDSGDDDGLSRTSGKIRLERGRVLGDIDDGETDQLLSFIMIDDHPTKFEPEPNAHHSPASARQGNSSSSSRQSLMKPAGKHRGSRANRLLQAMRDLGLIAPAGRRPTGPETDLKHIPAVYLYNSRAVQLQLLAGLIDSDGYYEEATNS